LVELPATVRELLEGPNYVHLATLMRDGAPHSVAVWAALEGNNIIVCTGDQALKARNTRRDPRVALSVTDMANPFRTAMIRGRVVEQRPDEDSKDMDRISHLYTGRPFPIRGPGRITIVIEPEWVRFLELPFEHAPGE